MVSSNDEADCQACAEDDAREDFKGIIEMTQPVRPLAFKPIAFETLVLTPLERPLAFKPRVFSLSSDFSKSKGLAALPMLAASPADPEDDPEVARIPAALLRCHLSAGRPLDGDGRAGGVRRLPLRLTQ